MFNKIKFAQILKNISNTYESQREFSKKSEINRTYLSQYMNMKLDKPPKPEILEKLAISSHGITTYAELMVVCGYYETDTILNNFHKTNFNRFYDDCKKYNLTDEQIDRLYNIFITLPQTESDFDEIFKDIPDEIEISISPIIKKYYKDTEKFLDYYEGLLIEKKNKLKPLLYMAPVYGQISAGQPNWAEECIEGRLPIDPNLMNIVEPEECFFLRVNGESMNKVIKNGAYALIRKQDYAEEGDIVVAIVNGDNEATLKRFKRFNEQFVSFEPMSSDESFKPINVDLKNTNVIILGKYIGKFEMK